MGVVNSNSTENSIQQKKIQIKLSAAIEEKEMADDKGGVKRKFKMN